MTKKERTDLADEIQTWKETLPELPHLVIEGGADIYDKQTEDHVHEDMRDENGVDRLCRELRLLSQGEGFHHLKLAYVPISEELFEDTLNPRDEMEWPNLRKLDICIHEMSSTGEWLLGETKYRNIFTDSYILHDKIVEEDIAPLRQAFTRAASTRMPKLEKASIQFGDDYWKRKDRYKVVSFPEVES